MSLLVARRVLRILTLKTHPERICMTSDRRRAHALAERKTRRRQTQPIVFVASEQNAEETFYTEEELNDFYRSLLVSEIDASNVLNPQPTLQEPTSHMSSTLNPQPANDTIENIERRLAVGPHLAADYSLATLLMQREKNIYEGSKEHVYLNDPNLQPYERLLRQLTGIIESAEQAHNDTSSSLAGGNEGSNNEAGPSTHHILPQRVFKLPIALPLVSYREWFELIQHCIYFNDVTAAHHTLGLMTRFGFKPPSGYCNLLLEYLSSSARIVDVEDTLLMMKHGMIPIDSEAIHYHLKAYTRSRRLSEACRVLHNYEEEWTAHKSSSKGTTSLPLVLPSQKTYSLVISSLIAQNHAHSRALGWDLFAHMRYVAHPIPDAHLYATMLRACANAPESQAERALDLWAEMREDNKITPTREAYNAVILACARASGAKLSIAGETFGHDAFRLAREMLDAYQSSGAEDLQPNVETFNALLESAKRTGDLERARWILAELVKAYTRGGEAAAHLAPNGDVMAHIFHVYAAYKPPFQRRDVKTQSRQGSSSLIPSNITNDVNGLVTRAPDTSTVSSTPQTHGEVLSEARTIFERLIEDQKTTHSELDKIPRAFGGVQHSTHLYNAYLSIHFTHNTLSAAREVYTDLFSNRNNHVHQYGVKPNAKTYLMVLQRCSRSASKKRNPKESKTAVGFTRMIWTEWMQHDSSGTTVQPRLVERIWSTMIRVLTLSGHIDEALDFVRDFTNRYPPQALGNSDGSYMSPEESVNAVRYSRHSRTHLKNPPANVKLNLQSQNSSPLPSSGTPPTPFCPNPLVQFASPSLVADPHVPPYFTFADVEVLHGRLLVLQRNKDVRYLTWLTKAYTGAVRRRRETRFNILADSNAG